MRRFNLIVILLCFLVPVDHAMAQAALAYEAIQPARIKVGESAILRVTSFGRLKDITLPTVPGLTFEYLGRQQGLEYVNGTGVDASFIQIRVTPQFASVFTIPALAPGAQAIGLEVVKGDEPNPYRFPSQQPAPPKLITASLPKGEQLQAGGAVFVHLAIPTRDIYVGESVPVDIELGLRPGIVTTINGLPTLTGSDFTLNNLSKEPERREESIDGNDFVVLTWHSAIAAVKPGDFSLAAQTPISVKLTTLSGADKAVASRMAWGLLSSLYNGIAPKEVKFESAVSTMKVLPLPTDGQPADFSGAVGNFHVSSDISPVAAAPGDPLTLRLHVTGAGNFDRVDSAMLGKLDHWKTYPAKSKFTPNDTVGYQGEKVFEQPLIASQSGEQSIPGLQFSYFNPNTRRYEYAQTQPLNVTIGGSQASGGTPNAAVMAQALQGLRADHPASRHSMRDLRPLYFQALYLATTTGLALLLAGGLFIVRPSAVRASSKAGERLMAKVEAAARAGDAAGFFEAARQALLKTGQSGQDVERLFALADEVKYSHYRPVDKELQHWLGVVRGHLLGEGR